MRRSLKIHRSLSFRLIFWVGLVLLVTIGTWAYFNIDLQEKKALRSRVCEADRLGTTIRLGTHYAMMMNSRDDITRIINNIGQQTGIENIRIYNKEGEIKFSNSAAEVDQSTNIKDEACFLCHRTEPPLAALELMERARILGAGAGYRSMGIISPIYNEPSCSDNGCHIHPKEKRVLGLLDVTVSLQEMDQEMRVYKRGILALAAAVFLGASASIGFFVVRFVQKPIRQLIKGTRHIGRGDYEHQVSVGGKDEIGQLAVAINQMGRQISEHEAELNQQRDEYQGLFESVPCYITVQDRDFKLLKFNRRFAETFNPESGDYCFRAYKSRASRCEACPVLRTFEDGQSHSSEEKGVRGDGSQSHWVVRTSPIRNAAGEIVAAMEVSLDVTRIRILEQEARRSEEKYRVFFNTIPNPVLVLAAEDLRIMDCNQSVTQVYGFGKEELLGRSFLELFLPHEREPYRVKLKSGQSLDQSRQLTKGGRTIFVNIRVSPSEYAGRQVLLVTTSDITQRLMAEQQLIQAGKMATLGEMATGVAHELNQPLTVMKTASSFILRKIRKGEPIEESVLNDLAAEIDSHVDRAARIISHMREFGRKAEVKKGRVQVNVALEKALEIFNQQLKLREIEVIRDFQPDLPPVMADENRLEQVFINLLINARDAIEERNAGGTPAGQVKRIWLKTHSRNREVIIEIEDTGMGIPAAILDRIFEPFFTTKRVGKGTGLGLSISYGIVHDYEGTIEAENQPGRGARFIIRFPAAQEG